MPARGARLLLGKQITVAALVLGGLGLPVAQALPRSSAVKSEFRQANPCPATGKTRGACPGWQIDHMHPLCAGGIDHPSNLNWIRTEDHKRKTRQDVKACRAAKPPRA